MTDTHKKLKVLLSGTGKENATDGFIYQGTTRLLREAFPGCDIHWYENPNEEDAASPPPGPFDLIVIMGSPWAWEGMSGSYKYKNALKLLQAYPTVPSIMMGGGSCVELGSDTLSENSKRTAKPLFDASSVTVARDVLMPYADYLLPCPSYFSIDPNPNLQRDGSIVVFAAPEESISYGYWQREKTRLKGFYDLIRQARDLGFDFYVTSKNADKDKAALKREVGVEAEVLEDTTAVEAAVGRAERVLSCRVHCAVPALVSGAEVRLIAFDTRHRTFVPGLEKKLKESKAAWISLLRSVVQKQKDPTNIENKPGSTTAI